MTKKIKTSSGLSFKSDLQIFTGLALILLFFFISGIVSYMNVQMIREGANQVTATHQILMDITRLESFAKDAETGQRGYLLTGNERYLAPYTAAVADLKKLQEQVEQTMQPYPRQLAYLKTMKSHIASKLEELQKTIDLRRTQGIDAAMALVLSDRGKTDMDEIRNSVRLMQGETSRMREDRIAEMNRAYTVATISGLLASGLGVILASAVAALMRRTARTRQRQEWLQSGQLGLSAAMTGEHTVDQLGDNILRFLTEYLGAHAGAYFVRDEDKFRRVATYGVPAGGGGTPKTFTMSDGLLGQAARDKRSFVITDVPGSYLTVGSALGQGSPRHLVIAPTVSDMTAGAVIELGFMHDMDEATLELLEKISESMDIAMRSAHYRAHLQNLLEETQRQSEELQAQGEELRVSNEELEEQSRALQESHARMEQQQAELEQTNAQLEEQTQQLETQRDDITRAQGALELRSRELEQASQYKSEFLANMSHELRTPLNSSLILAKLLADNPDSNLTDEQVRYAETIQSSGNDLLTLINDILDLSKIEAGHMEIRPEQVRLSKIAADVSRLFEAQAKQKGISFTFDVAPACPDHIETDGKRLEQVLKNLLSNAFKFTEKGEVRLSINRTTNGDIAFSVSDTGIGIAREQHAAIFDAFRQADSTTSRKYGGTGLGLSISRELSRLLGGRITLSSEPGKGSTFTVTLPQAYSAAIVRAPAPEAYLPPAHIPAVVEEKAPLPRAMDDDRDNLSPDKRTILIVEDDMSFAKVLYDLGHELGFQCLVAGTADEAIQVCARYLPSALILDVGLPDHSGLSVLDRLKQDPRTRHIPVHVVSAGDYSQTAFSLGAVGYMLKPVKREVLAEALKSLEERLVQRMRRVLVVEDDDVQRESLKKLLGLHNVETVGAGTAAECLELLKNETFDCMVLDLSLPDASGYSLLETLSREDAYSFPPVIVYTGRDLSAQDEQQLRRYSKSIIIKGAKSPERLLDEVTLFLHHVVADLPPEHQKMLKKAKNRDAILEHRRILVVEDDVRNVYSLTSILEPRGADVRIARNGREALEALQKGQDEGAPADLVLMDVMMPEMDGLAATKALRQNPLWKKLPVIMLTAKAMKDDQERCLQAGANDYMAKPIDVEKLLSLIRVWMPR